MAYKCVVFDFDGTLADTEEKTFNIYNDMAEQYKYRKITKEELQHIKLWISPSINYPESSARGRRECGQQWKTYGHFIRK